MSVECYRSNRFIVFILSRIVTMLVNLHLTSASVSFLSFSVLEKYNLGLLNVCFLF